MFDIGVIKIEFLTLQYVLEFKYLTTMSRNWSDLQPALSNEINSTIKELGFQFMTPVQVSKCKSKYLFMKISDLLDMELMFSESSVYFSCILF